MAGIENITQLSNLLNASGVSIDKHTNEWFMRVKKGSTDYLPFLTTEYYLQTALQADDAGCRAILKQIIPDIREFDTAECELKDPLGEEKFSPFPRFVHRYEDRALILVTDRCAMYCRHCFRRSFSGGINGPLSDAELTPMAGYLAEHREINEVLLTGGDPLTLSNERLFKIIARIKSVRPELVVRVCSRMPVVNPDRISRALADGLGSYEGIWFVTHFNHAAELTEYSRAAVRRLLAAGIPVLNQSVLLKGVNDDLSSLKELFQKLLRFGVKPYYLFQGDLARGTSHLRVPLRRALELTSKLKYEISGMAMPRFAVDLPGGGGKITLPSQSHPVDDEGEFYIIKGLDNEEYRYPAN